MRRVLNERKLPAAVARDLDLSHCVVTKWVEGAQADQRRSTLGTLTTEEMEELTRWRRENRELRLEREILKKAAAPLSRRRTGEILVHPGEEGRARALKAVQSIGCFALQDERLKVLVRDAYERKGRTYYGSPRVHRTLQKQDVRVSRKRVVRLMQEEGLVARVRRRLHCTTDSNHARPVAENLLNRDFTSDAPDRRWVTDTTELSIPNGRLFLAVVLDLYSRFVVGWALSAVNDRHLTVKALEMALGRPRPAPETLHHCDRGSTYPLCQRDRDTPHREVE